MQLGLRHAGCYPADEETEWWQFGPSTVEALRTFQAMEGLPETGVCAASTWKRLLRDDDAQPADIHRISPRDSVEEAFEDDLAAGDDLHGTERIFLLGEQRWVSLPKDR